MAASTTKTDKRTPRRVEIGVVTSAHKTPKTLRVEVQYQVKHPIYEKIIRRTRRLHVHDEKVEAKLGDRVEVMECRRISKQKSWRLVKVLESA